MRLDLLITAATLATACTKPFPPRACEMDDECLEAGIDGVCLPSPLSVESWCAFPDQDCASGQRWGIRAGDDLTETCVDLIDAGLPDAFIADSGPDACLPLTEICDGLDSDCDGLPDNGCPGEIATAFPWNGYTTGSAWGTSGTLVAKPRRPTFRWATVAEATSYQLQVDDSCATPGFATCDFPSPEVDATPASTSFAPAADLPISMINPVGRRYYWRVRACNVQGCGPWTAVRYLDVARLRDDFNGDGYSDVVVGAWANSTSLMGGGRAYIYFGGTTFNTMADATFSGVAVDDALGGGVAAAGDLNGDGYADAAIAAPLNDTPGNNAGRVYVYFGGPGPTFETLPEGTLSGAAAGIHFGEEVAGAGDLNGDGFSDLIVGTIAGQRAEIFFGGPGGTFETTSDLTLMEDGLAFAVASSGDVNGDGYCDVLAGAPYDDSVGVSSGRAYLYLGSSAMDAVADWHADGEVGADQFGLNLSSAGDVNADGFSDVLVSSRTNNIGGMNAGRAYMFLGGVAMDATADATFTGTLGDQLGSLAGRGDVNNDGYDDIVVGASSADVGVMYGAGRVYVYFGGAGAFDTTADGFLNGTAQSDAFGADMSLSDVNGDGRWDVFAGAYLGGPSDTGTVSLFLGGPGTTMDGTSDAVLSGQAMYDWFGREVD